MAAQSVFRLGIALVTIFPRPAHGFPYRNFVAAQSNLSAASQYRGLSGIYATAMSERRNPKALQTQPSSSQGLTTLQVSLARGLHSLVAVTRRTDAIKRPRQSKRARAALRSKSASTIDQSSCECSPHLQHELFREPLCATK